MNVDYNLTTELVRELLDYDPETWAFTWRERGRQWFKSDRSWKAWTTRYAGKPAGYVDTNATGYLSTRISVSDKQHLAHRLAFIWMGEPLPAQVDHLDRDATNNRWANLAASSQAENARNQSRKSSNTSRITGVSWHKAKGKWVAQVSLRGKRKHLGLFTDLNEAAAAVAAFRAKLGYSANHGKYLAHYHQGDK